MNDPALERILRIVQAVLLNDRLEGAAAFPVTEFDAGDVEGPHLFLPIPEPHLAAFPTAMLAAFTAINAMNRGD